MQEVKKWLGWLLILMFLLSCAGQSTEILGISSSTVDTSQGIIVTASWNGNMGTVTYYDINGTYLFHSDYRSEGFLARGLSHFTASSFLVAYDGNDSIYSFDFFGNRTLFFGAGTFAGNIYDLAYDSVTDVVYAIESNNIEAFDSSGNRLTAQQIPDPTGACNFNGPVAMTINANGNLVVANVNGSDQIFTFDITTTPPTCLSAVNFGNNPYAVLQHSDGNLYIATLGDDQIYRTDQDGANPVVVWATDLSVINDPYALAELPNGNILVSSRNTDTIEEITTAGVRVGTAPFIIDAFSQEIGDILVIPGSSP